MKYNQIMNPKRRANSAEKLIKSKNIFSISCEHEQTKVETPIKKRESGL